MDLRIDGLNRNLNLAACIALATAMICMTAPAQTAAQINSAGASIYKSNCAICHGDDGAGTALGKRLHTPDLRSSKIHRMTPASLALQIRAGKNNMPPFADKLSGEEIQRVVEYVRQIQAGTPGAAKTALK